MRILWIGPAVLQLLVVCATVRGEAGVTFANPTVERWKFGIVVTASEGPALGIIAAAPVPSDWPEQKIRVVEESTSPEVQRMRFRTVGDGARQMVVEIPRLAAGQSAEAMLTVEITKSEIHEPGDPSSLAKPARITRNLRVYLSPSPQIESNHREIEALAAQISENQTNSWETVLAIYDWVRENVQYREGPLKGALAALHDRDGDCEELTSLFIALCRAQGIPARTVWVPGHCYPEFYLEDAQGKGHWFPCQAAGASQFGEMIETRPILQKGDNFRLPEERQAVRYARPILKSTPRPGFIHPSITVVQERVEP